MRATERWIIHESSLFAYNLGQSRMIYLLLPWAIMKNQKVVWLSQWNGPVAVIGLIAILVILLLPAVQQARESVVAILD